MLTEVETTKVYLLISTPVKSVFVFLGYDQPIDAFEFVKWFTTAKAISKAMT